MTSPRELARLFLLLSIVLWFGGCGENTEPNQISATAASAGGERRPKSHLVTSITTERALVSARYERPGTLRLRRLVRIYSLEEGRITKFDLFEGDRVARDQTLMRLEDDLLRAELDKARASRDQADLELERLMSLIERRAASNAELAQARTALAIADAELRLLQTRLTYTRIQAPFAGIIIERLVEPGDFVTKNTHLLTLADPASMLAEVSVSELVLPHVAVGDPVRIRIDALGDRDFDGNILRIHPTLSEVNRQAKVEMRFKQIPDGARAGQFIRATLVTAAVPRLLIPFSALRQDREGQFVWLIDSDDTAAKCRVQSGLRIADRIEILQGLEPGDKVITRGFLGLDSGTKVTLIDSDGIDSDGIDSDGIDNGGIGRDRIDDDGHRKIE
ncbi:MAG: efflux RND transporter periplasmic adaptor subunit [Thiohalocapsa sp. PB-PSB1]|jgi:RND family efflux transporter MFP subunit|nr:MAG: efflux RND transporter periplasmic adaptor subunit [Thiohalocapsa sp. PB-PSB1]HCS90833.1 efflux RND transporter periplasmic adaptor subunit [Chromatiaceae bacterium]